jgi:hypothetical protein
MDYWAETMQDDAYLIAADGWVAGAGAHRRDRQEGQEQGQGLGLRPHPQAKWMARLSAAVQGELDRVSQTLTGRIRELAERYATPLPSSPTKWRRSPPGWMST